MNAALASLHARRVGRGEPPCLASVLARRQPLLDAAGLVVGIGRTSILRTESRQWRDRIRCGSLDADDPRRTYDRVPLLLLPGLHQHHARRNDPGLTRGSADERFATGARCPLGSPALDGERLVRHGPGREPLARLWVGGRAVLRNSSLSRSEVLVLVLGCAVSWSEAEARTINVAAHHWRHPMSALPVHG